MEEVTSSNDSATATLGSLYMKGSDESHKEVGVRIRGVLTAKHITRVGTYNVRTANSCGKLAQILSEMKRYRLKILGISEMRWPSSGKFISEDITVLFSGGEKHEKRVGLLFDKLSAKAIVSWEPVSDRIITARLKTRFTNVTMIQI